MSPYLVAGKRKYLAARPERGTMHKKGLVVLLGLATLLTCAAAGAMVEPVLSAALSRYPGSIRVADQGLDLEQLWQGLITRQAVYQTGSEFSKVENWYMERMNLAPADSIGPDASGCTLLSQAEKVYWFEHTLAVVLCARPHGTQVMVNEKLALVR